MVKYIHVQLELPTKRMEHGHGFVQLPGVTSGSLDDYWILNGYLDEWITAYWTNRRMF